MRTAPGWGQSYQTLTLGEGNVPHTISMLGEGQAQEALSSWAYEVLSFMLIQLLLCVEHSTESAFTHNTQTGSLSWSIRSKSRKKLRY